MAPFFIQPNLEFEASYREYIRELGDELRYPFPLDFDHSDFSSLLDRLADFQAGRNLPAGYVASSTFWFVEAGEILGVSNVRHTSNKEIHRCGGHIGLSMRPSQRGRGLGTELMSLTILEAWKRGIDLIPGTILRDAYTTVERLPMVEHDHCTYLCRYRSFYAFHGATTIFHVNRVDRNYSYAPHLLDRLAVAKASWLSPGEGRKMVSPLPVHLPCRKTEAVVALGYRVAASL